MVEKSELDRNREKIRLAVTIILYLLLAMAFFQFKEVEQFGVKNLVFWLFFLSLFSLVILFVFFVNLDKKTFSSNKTLFNLLLALACTPFVLFYILIFTRILFYYLFNRGMYAGVKGFFNGVSAIIIYGIFTSESFLVLFLVLDIILFVIFVLMVGLIKIKSP
jgi:hypothetical protein